MAAQVPTALKAVDITRFAHRAAQLETVEPVIAYWCDYYMVNQILSKGLHSADQECLQFTTALMDKLEKFKADNQTNDIVTDDLAGKAYVEQFGLETFQRADNAVRANKASRQTADTFHASATFLDLLQIWGQLEPEIVAKSKYAKYNALRIAKAIKAGEDPNLSNPKIEPEEEELSHLDANDPDLQMLNGGNSLQRQPSVVEVPDETDRTQRHLAQRSHLDESLHPSRAPSIPREGEARQPSIEHVADEAHRLQSKTAPQSTVDQSIHPSRTHTPPAPQSGIYDVSPLRQPTEPIDPVNEVTAISPYQPKTAVNANPQSAVITFPLSLHLSSTHRKCPTLSLSRRHHPQIHHYRNHPQPSSPPNSSPPTNPHNSLPTRPSAQLRPNPPSDTTHPQTQPRHQTTQQIPQQIYHPPVEIDEQAIMKAQKHARFAISALNFEDVPTAVKELRGALATLGGALMELDMY